jgi:general secretion pathway protein A
MFLLYGDIGSGKTTISQFLLSGWRGDPSISVAYITNPSVRTEAAFLRMILEHYGIENPPRNQQPLWNMLRAMLIANYREGKTTVLVVDEAHTISNENFMTLTHLANEQTTKEKLIQIVLVGQREIVGRLNMRPALRERIALSSQLNPMSPDDAIAMLRHRLSVAGGDLDTLFPGDLPKTIFYKTNGIPRRLCILCHNVLMNAFIAGSPCADTEAFERALLDVEFKGWEEPNGRTANAKTRKSVSRKRSS